MREYKFRGRTTTSGMWQHGSLVIRGGKAFIVNRDGEYPVLPETVGQFTEKYDMNRDEIYEGDRITHENQGFAYTGIVGFNLGYHMSGFFIEWSTLSCEVRMNKCKIIGNIHDVNKTSK